MKLIIITLIALTLNSMAGIESIKKKHESDVMKAHKRYLYSLKLELRRSREPNDIVEIDNEIKRIEEIINPMKGDYVIKYDTGIRNYRFEGDATVYYIEGKERAKFIRKGKYIIIEHSSGSVETWEKQPDGTYLVGFQNTERLIPGKARKK